ncbi:hypothetical protein AA313_de0207796 [Arthrobotrys entomopaga]|nr:hypothetical protein AA313_de0207796 [Arthrobotrys entomopaga]
MATSDASKASPVSDIASPTNEKFDTLPRTKSAVCVGGIRSFSDMTRLEAEQQRQLGEYIVGDSSKRPAVIQFKVYWKLSTKSPRDGSTVDLFEAAYINGTAFAVTPRILLTARHIFRPPTAKEVLEHYPEMIDDFAILKDMIKQSNWTMTSIKWTADDSDAGYELGKAMVFGCDLGFLRSLEKDHHRLALAGDNQGGRCWTIGVDKSSELKFWAGIWNWNTPGFKGNTTCFVGDGYSGSPLLNDKGHAIGLISHTVGAPDDLILGRFYGSAYLLKCIIACFPDVMEELKPGGLTEASLPDKAVFATMVDSANEYGRTLSSNDPDSDDCIKLEPSPKRQRKGPKARPIRCAISKIHKREHKVLR